MIPKIYKQKHMIWKVDEHANTQQLILHVCIVEEYHTYKRYITANNANINNSIHM